MDFTAAASNYGGAGETVRETFKGAGNCATQEHLVDFLEPQHVIRGVCVVSWSYRCVVISAIGVVLRPVPLRCRIEY